MLPKFLIGLVCLLLGNGVCLAQIEKQRPVKVSAALAQRLYYSGFQDSVDLVLALKKNVPLKPGEPSYRIVNAYQNFITIRTASKNILSLLKDSNTVFADVVKTPKEELTTGSLDLATNKLNTARDRYPNITGSGILASIKEQQFDTTDIDYMGRYVNTGAAASTFTTHAAIMATTLAGAGNSSPFAEGAAPGTLVTSTSFASLLPEPDAYYQLFQIPIQNHSYGTIVENYYGAEAAAYDQNVATNPSLVHVFSSGNSGTAAGAGPYSSLQGWGNLTGNFKTAKNVLVVGAIDSTYQVASASSKGPTFDGRVKPDLVAFGEDGSSGAAAITSGTVALLQQAYTNTHQHLPSAALVKAVLINSADDVAQPGIDYTSGYGSLNGYRALQTVLKKNFFEDSLQYGDLKKFTMAVPSNTALLKVTLAWTDPPAPVNASMALVNDLDLIVKNNGGESWLPWVLNASANIDSLTKPATRQRDTLNNVEQITINDPQPGTYDLEVTGSRISTPMQSFAVAYQLDTANTFEWSFPTGADAITAAKTAVLHWQTTKSGTGILEYRTSENNWRILSDTVALAQGFYKWVVADTLTTAQLRMRFSDGSTAYSDTFTISPILTLQVGFHCADSGLLFWNSLPVTQYQVYRLGDKYLQPMARVADTSFLFKTTASEAPFYSVAPIVDGRVGLKSYTLNVTTQGAGCYVRSFYLQAQTNQSATFTLLTGTSYKVATIAFEKLKNGSYATLQNIQNPQATDFTFSDSLLQQGVNWYRVQITLKNGAVIYSDVVPVYYVARNTILLYPNPARANETINMLVQEPNLYTLQIMDAAGRLVYKQRFNDGTQTFSSFHLPAGVYFIQILSDTGSRYAQKLLVY